MEDTAQQSTSKRTTIIMGLVFCAFIAGGVYWYTARVPSFDHQFAQGEIVTEWNFQGAYTGKSDLETKAATEIERLNGLLGVEGDDVTDYIVYVSIANQHRLLGNGAEEYAYLKKALAIDSEITGLAWYNLGTLLARLGAPKSARDAYARAVKAQNQQIGYQSMYLEYLTGNFKDEVGAIEEAFKGAEDIFGENATLLQTKARWLESIGRPAEAIDAWKKVIVLSPQSAPIIQQEITRLETSI